MQPLITPNFLKHPQKLYILGAKRKSSYMGQALSSPKEQANRGGSTQCPPPVPHLPATLSNPHRTVVIDLGTVENDEVCYWYIEGGLRRFPLPVGYRATCHAYSTVAHLSVERSPDSHAPMFVLRPEGDKGASESTLFSGLTPTAPFAKWALALGRLDVVNGMQAFGFRDLSIQYALREMVRFPGGALDTPVSQCAPGSVMGSWVERIRRKARSRQVTEGGTLVERIQRGILEGVQEEAAQRGAPTTAPSLQKWLEHVPGGMKSGDTREQESSVVRQHTAKAEEGQIPSATQAPGTTRSGPPVDGDASALYSDRVIGTPPLLSRALPPAYLPAQKVLPSANQFTPRPRSGQHHRKGRPASAQGGTGRGWTAFTAFGLEMRDVVRSEYPWASATEVEKVRSRPQQNI